MLFRYGASRGFSLKELAIVLAVMGTLFGGLMRLMIDMRRSTQLNTAQQQVIQTMQGVRDYFVIRALPSTAADASTNYTHAILRAAGVFPEDTCPSNCVAGTITTVYNTYGGTITFSLPTTSSIPNPNEAQITLSNITKNGCVNMGTKLTADAVPLGIISITAGSTTITSFPASLDTMDTACTSSTANNFSVVFKINK